MKQITKQERQSIFALYLNQPIAHHNDLIKIDGCTPLDIFGTHSEEFIERYSLFVKPLSKITDEDAIDVARLQGNKPLYEYQKPYDLHFDTTTPDIDVCIQYKGYNHDYYETLTLPSIDYLRGKGYALPCSEYTVDDLIAAGVFKINDNI